jgi:hypothetical protein
MYLSHESFGNVGNQYSKSCRPFSWRSCLAACGVLFLNAARQPVHADDWFGLALPAPPTVVARSLDADLQPSQDSVSGFLSAWAARAERARAAQPTWSSPLVTTSALLEQRLRFDVAEQYAGNGANTTVVDAPRSLDLIVSDSNDIRIGAPPYDVRTTPSGKGAFSGYADWPFLRVKQRVASSPETDGNYVVSTWLQLQAPTGIGALTSNAFIYQPTIAFGKGWGNFDVQATVAAVLPASHTETLGHQIQTNIAFQYHLLDVLWPEIEVNWTYYPDGPRAGLNQVFITTGLVIGRFRITDGLQFTFGGGYQIALAPTFRPSPLTPAYDHAWLFTSRLNF